MIRQEVLTTRNPPLELSAVIDESVLLRKVGSREVMFEQLRHLAEMAQLPHIELRILLLQSETSLKADSFVVFGFSPQHETSKLGDVASTEGIESEIYIEGETDTYIFRLIFQAFAKAALDPDDSRELILRTAEQLWALAIWSPATAAL
jgi:Domain of unknown function (DUF5753)